MCQPASGTYYGRSVTYHVTVLVFSPSTMSYTPSPSPPRTPPTSDSECEESSKSRIHQLNSQSPSPTPSHPFAASTKADRAPPVYEKKPFTPPTTPPCPKENSFLHREVIYSPEVKTQAARLSTRHSPSLADEEQKRWDTTISSAIDKAETKIDLRCAYMLSCSHCYS